MFRIALELAGGDESRLVSDDDGITIRNPPPDNNVDPQ